MGAFGLALLACALALPAMRQEAPAPEERAAARLTLPPGPVAEALASLTPDTEPAPLEGDAWPDWSLRDAGGWGAPEPWLRWAQLVRAEAQAETADPQRRAQLALCARAQGRDRDAWGHLAQLGNRPDLMAALLPAYVPGITRDASDTSAPGVLTGGLPADLQPGALLRPPLPPALDRAQARALGLFQATYRHPGFAVGPSRVALEVELAEDGVEITLELLEGPAVHLRFLPPMPRGQTLRSVYANWERVEDPLAPIPLGVTPEEPEAELWARFFATGERWPEALPSGLDARLQDGALRLVGDPEDAFLQALAAGLGALFETECAVLPEGTPAVGVREPLALRIDPADPVNQKLQGLLSRAEAYLLR